MPGAGANGNHSWLLADPDAFGEVITNVLEVAKLARTMESAKPVKRLLHKVKTLRG